VNSGVSATSGVPGRLFRHGVGALGRVGQGEEGLALLFHGANRVHVQPVVADDDEAGLAQAFDQVAPERGRVGLVFREVDLRDLERCLNIGHARSLAAPAGIPKGAGSRDCVLFATTNEIPVNSP
jgi:hypothetical protein